MKCHELKAIRSFTFRVDLGSTDSEARPALVLLALCPFIRQRKEKTKVMEMMKEMEMEMDRRETRETKARPDSELKGRHAKYWSITYFLEVVEGCKILQDS